LFLLHKFFQKSFVEQWKINFESKDSRERLLMKGGGMKLSVWDFLSIGVAVAFFIVYLISKEQATKDFCSTMIFGLSAAAQLERRMKDEKTSLKDNRVYQFSFALLFLSYGACILNYFVFHTNLINRACLILYIGFMLFNLVLLDKKRKSLVS